MTFWKKKKGTIEIQAQETTPVSKSSSEPKSPYVAAREEWNTRYGDYIASAHNWRRVALISSLTALIAVAGVVYIGAQNKRVPYVVEVDRLGQAAYVGLVGQSSATDPKLISAFLVRFIQDFRAVSVDPVAQKGTIDRLYSMIATGTPALEKVSAYYQENSPFVVATHSTVFVEVQPPLPISDRTWHIEWLEIRRNMGGQVQTRARYKATLTVAISPPNKNEAMQLVNPLGLFVTDLNWSQQIESK